MVELTVERSQFDEQGKTLKFTRQKASKYLKDILKGVFLRLTAKCGTRH